MARGILESDKNHLITFHPNGTHNSTECLNDADYLSFHTAQTGHDVQQCYESDQVMRRMAEASDKPYMDSEPRYDGLIPRASTTKSAISGTRTMCARTPIGT